MRLLFVVVVARGLGPNAFGVYGLVLAVTEILAVASGAGYTDYLTRESAIDRCLGWGLARQLTLLRIGLAALIALVVLAVLKVFGYPPSVLTYSALMFITIVPRSVSEAIQGVLRGLRRYAAVLAIEAGVGLGLVAGAAVLLARQGGMTVVVGTEIAAAIIGAFVAEAVAVRMRTRERITLEFSRLLKTSAVFNAYALLVDLYDRLDVVMLSRLAGDFATGIYSAAYRALGMVQMLPYGVMYSLLPSVSRGTWGKTERERVERAMGLLLSMALFIVLATMTFAGPAIHLLLGARYDQTILAVKILIWAVVLRYLNFALNISLLALRRERVFVVTSLICLAVNVIGNLIFIPRFSWRAAAVMTIVTEAALLAQNVYWVRRALGSVPVPYRGLRTSGLFALLVPAILFGGRLFSPVLIGIGCMAIFFFYLAATGTITELGKIWRSKREAME